MTRITDELGHVTSYKYDAKGNIERIEHPDGRHAAAKYHPQGMSREVTDARGQTTKHFYDAHGRLERALNPDGSSGCSATTRPATWPR